MPLIFSGQFYLSENNESYMEQVRAWAGLSLLKCGPMQAWWAICAVRCGAGLKNNVAVRVRAPAGQWSAVRVWASHVRGGVGAGLKFQPAQISSTYVTENIDNLIFTVSWEYLHLFKEMKWWCFRRLLCTLFRLNWAKQTPGIMRRN